MADEQGQGTWPSVLLLLLREERRPVIIAAAVVAGVGLCYQDRIIATVPWTVALVPVAWGVMALGLIVIGMAAWEAHSRFVQRFRSLSSQIPKPLSEFRACALAGRDMNPLRFKAAKDEMTALRGDLARFGVYITVHSYSRMTEAADAADKNVETLERLLCLTHAGDLCAARREFSSKEARCV